MLLRKLLTGTTIVCLVTLFGCGRGEEPEQPQPPTERAAGKTVDPATAATIQGRVLYQDGQPRRNRIRMAADAVCIQQHQGPVYSQEVALNDNGTLRYVFVYVKSQALADYSFPTPTEAVVLDQRGCLYTPHVIGAQTNQEIKIMNSDPTTHNIHPIPRNNREWNTSMGPNAEPLLRSFPREEVMIPVKCNVHPWMRSYVGVLSHPFFAVTGQDGTFKISGLPPGDYTIIAWQEKLGTVEQTVTVGASETQEVDLSFTPGGSSD
ncbi:MAG: carboxypeptidase regulatory-like domain-containing protein [Terriglobia bacterium]